MDLQLVKFRFYRQIPLFKQHYLGKMDLGMKLGKTARILLKLAAICLLMIVIGLESQMERVMITNCTQKLITIWISKAELSDFLFVKKKILMLIA